MSAVVIIAIVVAALIALALVVVYVRRRVEQRQVLRKRLASEATGHRQEADAHATKAQEPVSYTHLTLPTTPYV